MSKAIALTQRTIETARQRQSEALSSVIVIASAAALIFAGQPLPL